MSALNPIPCKVVVGGGGGGGGGAQAPLAPSDSLWPTVETHAAEPHDIRYCRVRADIHNCSHFELQIVSIHRLS